MANETLFNGTSEGGIFSGKSDLGSMLAQFFVQVIKNSVLRSPAIKDMPKVLYVISRIGLIFSG